MVWLLFLPFFFSLGFSQFFSGTVFAPIPTAFPRFSATSTFASFGSFLPGKKTSVYNPNPVPADPTADPALTARLASPADLKIKNLKGSAQLNALYDQGSFRSWNMEITPDNVALMKEDPSQELKVHCRITADYGTPEAKTFSGYGIGCGYKGSVGSLRVCLDEYHRSNGGCRKLSIRVEASAFKLANKTNPSFYGARNLIFNGMAVDWSLMSERTAYNLLADLGVTAPLATHAKLFLNGKYLGVYSFIQDVDGAFAEVRFKEDKGKGTLYKDMWFNQVHLKELAKNPHKDDNFMREVMAAIDATPVSYGPAKALFDKYFEVDSLVASTAFNTVIGNSDDWRQRHNFYWYVSKEKNGMKKLHFVPWDYDRLYDEMADTRGPLKGRPWWKISETTGGSVCNQPIFTPEQMARMMGGSPAMIAYNKDIWNQYPPDMEIPVSCDKITQLMAVALGPKVRAKTLEFTRRINMAKVRKNWETWTAQIQAAVAADPDGPNLSKMRDEQRKLDNHIGKSMSKAAAEANAEPISSSTTSIGLSSSATFPSFSAPMATIGTPAPMASIGTPVFGTSFSTPSFPAASFAAPPPQFGAAFQQGPAPFSAGFGVGFGR